MLKKDKLPSINYLTDSFFRIVKTVEMEEKFLSFLENKIIKKSQISHMFFGCELEFYLLTFKNSTPDLIIEELRQSDCKNIIFEIKKEIGENQFEIIPTISTNPFDLCNKVEKIKSKLKEICFKNFSFCYFDAKPFSNQPPSSMQISISFYNQNDENLLNKNRTFSHAIIWNLLNDMKSSSIFSNPTTKCYHRLENLEYANKYRNFPTHVSWGLQTNRTTAIRMTTIPEKKERRLEYRLPSAGAKSSMVLISMLSSILDAVQNLAKCSFNCPEPIASNVFEDETVRQHNLLRLPTSLKIADEQFIYSSFRKKLNHITSDFMYENDIQIEEERLLDALKQFIST